MLNNIYLFKHANYYNRIVKRFDHLNEYVSNSNLLASYSGINFNPNDGVSTNLVINYNEADMPDYLIVADEDIILSRWYIIESRRTRSGQFSIDLYRDVIADWYEDVIKAPCFIEKATVGAVNDPAIFNNEDMSFNQIKTSETLLKDKLGTGWYVGYFDKNAGNVSVSISNLNVVPSGDPYQTFESYPFNDYVAGKPAEFKAETLTAQFYARQNIDRIYFMKGWDLDGYPKTPTVPARPTDTVDQFYYDVPSVLNVDGDKCGYDMKATSFVTGVSKEYDRLLERTRESNPSYWRDGIEAAMPQEPSNLSLLLAENGKYRQIADNVYKINVQKSERKTSWSEVNTSTPYGKKIADLSGANSKLNTNNSIAPIGGIEYTFVTYTLSYEYVANQTMTYTIPTTTIDCLDSPYNIFAIPAMPIYTETSNKTSEDTSKRLLDALIIALGKKLYDIQYLPYYPETVGLRKVSYEGGKYAVDETLFPDDGLTHVDYISVPHVAPIHPANTYGYTIILYPRYSSLEFTIDDITIPAKTSVIDVKLSNECDMYRLCSPNYNGQFEFSPAKNGGVSGFNVSYTLKPFSPYIKVAPIFNQLYGGNFGDARGLICGGDFSMSQIESYWTNYEISNKNYQVMFDRQIQNLEVNNSVSRIREKVSAISGTLSGTISGGTAAGVSTGGNPYAMAGGAILGGVASGVAGAYDITLNERLRREAIDFTKDQFGYSLQNIQALPYSLNKVGTQNADFKVFPFIEYFTCSPVEKNALLNKIKYNGMTIMRIGAIEEYIQPEKSYIKARLIRLESIYDDYHVINMIAKELNEGVFI